MKNNAALEKVAIGGRHATEMDLVKRTQLQLDDRLHEALRRRAFEEGCSMSDLARRLLGQALGTVSTDRRRTLGDFSFVAVGESTQGDLAPVSERHDAALAEPEPE